MIRIWERFISAIENHLLFVYLNKKDMKYKADSTGRFKAGC